MAMLRTLLALGVLFAIPDLAGAQFDGAENSRKPFIPAARAAGPIAASEDFGDVAVVVDNGLLVTPLNPFDLSEVTLHFEPFGGEAFNVSRFPAALETDFGPALTFGFPEAVEFPGDDDTQEVAFPASLPFLGKSYATVWVNTDGNVTLGAPDFASNDRDKARHVLGPPRISAFLHDWNPSNAFNPGGSGSIHAVVESNPDRLVVTWNGVADFVGGISSTFQLVLHATGVVEITLWSLDPASIHGVVGIAEGDGGEPFQVIDFASLASGMTLEAGAIMESFSELTRFSHQEVAREFFRTHPDRFDFLTIMTDFPIEGFVGPFFSDRVSNQTHGIGSKLSPATGQPFYPTVYDFSSLYGSAGELEQILFMNNVDLFPSNPERVVNPPIEPYRPTSNIMLAEEIFGGPVSLDGQTMSQIRVVGTLPMDDGEFSRFFARSGSYSLGTGLVSPMSMMAHMVGLRWAPWVRIVHPTSGSDFDTYDLLGRDITHWSFFFSTTVPDSQFAGVPRCSSLEGNAIVDLGPLTDYQGTAVDLGPGESMFLTPADQLYDGYTALDQYLMGIIRAAEVGPFFYVDEPVSIYSGESLDAYDPSDPLNTSITMRGWQAMGGSSSRASASICRSRMSWLPRSSVNGATTPRASAFGARGASSRCATSAIPGAWIPPVMPPSLCPRLAGSSATKPMSSARTSSRST